MPIVVVAIPAPLRRAAGGLEELAAEGDTVAAALSSLRRDHAAVARLFLKQDGEPRGAVLLVLNGEKVRPPRGLEHRLKEGDRIEVVLLMAGG